VANKHIPYHIEKFGYSKPNVNFIKGYIEKMVEAGLKENSFDVIV
jgi:arsenite methyltransferase